MEELLRLKPAQVGKLTRETVKELLTDLKLIFPRERTRINFLLTTIDSVDNDEFIENLCKEILPHKKKVSERNVDELIAVLKVFVSDIDESQWTAIGEENRNIVWEYADTLIVLLSVLDKLTKSS